MFFKKLDGDKLVPKVPLWCKKSFSFVVIFPHTLRCCSECKNISLFDECDKIVNQRKEFSANLNQIKRQAPYQFGHMLPWYKTIWMW